MSIPITGFSGHSSESWDSILIRLMGDGVYFLSLLIASSALIWVCWAIIDKFNAIRRGKSSHKIKMSNKVGAGKSARGKSSEWGDLGLLVIVGVFLILFIVWLLNELNTIFP